MIYYLIIYYLFPLKGVRGSLSLFSRCKDKKKIEILKKKDS